MAKNLREQISVCATLLSRNWWRNRFKRASDGLTLLWTFVITRLVDFGVWWSFHGLPFGYRCIVDVLAATHRCDDPSRLDDLSSERHHLVWLSNIPGRWSNVLLALHLNDAYHLLQKKSLRRNRGDESVVDSGASVRMMSKKELIWEELDFVWMIKSNGSIVTDEEAQVYAEDLDMFRVSFRNDRTDLSEPSRPDRLPSNKSSDTHRNIDAFFFFSKDPNYEKCKRTQITRPPCRRRIKSDTLRRNHFQRQYHHKSQGPQRRGRNRALIISMKSLCKISCHSMDSTLPK